MNWVFWALIIIALAVVWLALIIFFRPVGHGVDAIRKAIDEVMYGEEDGDNLLDEEGDKENE